MKKKQQQANIHTNTQDDITQGNIDKEKEITDLQIHIINERTMPLTSTKSENRDKQTR